MNPARIDPPTLGGSIQANSNVEKKNPSFHHSWAPANQHILLLLHWNAPPMKCDSRIDLILRFFSSSFFFFLVSIVM